jgi:transcriptional regulator with XRE-family HTH domain
MNMDAWLKFFDSAAGTEAMGKLLYDIYDEVKAQEEREAGKHKMGRRPARDAVSIDELFSVVFPAQYSNDPLPEALRKLMAGRSQRQFAQRIPCSQPWLARILSGEATPDIYMIEAIADAAKVPPWFFPEWRAMFLSNMVLEAYTRSPHLSITALRAMRSARHTHQRALV